MAARSKKPRPRGYKKQLEDIKKLRTRAEAGSLLDVGSKYDLLIDDYVKDYGKGDRLFLRSAVEKIGQHVVSDANFMVELPADANEIGKRALQTLAKVDRDSRWMLNLDEPTKFALEFAFVATEAAIEEGYPIRLGWLEAVKAFEFIHELHALIKKKFELTQTYPGGRSEMLVHFFAVHMSHFHEKQLGHPAPTSKSGRFVRFMQAAWADLQFPEIPEDALGYKAERLPHLLKSISG